MNVTTEVEYAYAQHQEDGTVRLGILDNVFIFTKEQALELAAKLISPNVVDWTLLGNGEL